MWVKVNFQLVAGNWVSLATFSSYADWRNVVVVNLSVEYKVHLFHVPEYKLGGEALNCQGGNCNVTFPRNTWVRLDIYLDMHSTYGMAMVWQNGVLVNSAAFTSQTGQLRLAHFGLYTSPVISQGEAFNDKLRIQEVFDQVEAEILVKAPF